MATPHRKTVMQNDAEYRMHGRTMLAREAPAARWAAADYRGALRSERYAMPIDGISSTAVC